MTDKTLRQLAKDYANGVIDMSSYRDARDHLLSGIAANEIPVATNDFRPLIKTHDLDRTLEKTEIRTPATSPSIDDKKEEPTTAVVDPANIPDDAAYMHGDDSMTDTENTGKLIAIIVIVVILVGIGYFLFKPAHKESANENNPASAPVADTMSQETSTDTQETTSQPAESKEISVGEQSSVAASLIEDFLQKNDWSDESLQTFKNSWAGLSYQEQTDELASSMKSRLANAINQKLVEERALMAIESNADESRQRQTKLVNFAAEIGINDPRLKIDNP